MTRRLLLSLTASLAPGCSAGPGLCILIEFRGESDKYLPPFALASSAGDFRQLPTTAGLETYVLGKPDLERLATHARDAKSDTGAFRLTLFPASTHLDLTPGAIEPWLRQVLAITTDDAMKRRVVSYLARAGTTP